VVEKWSWIFGVSHMQRWRRKAGPPQFLTECHQHIGEGDGRIHGFVGMFRAIDKGKEAIGQSAQTLAAAFAFQFA
jgi:hypothetical protein